MMYMRKIGKIFPCLLVYISIIFYLAGSVLAASKPAVDSSLPKLLFKTPALEEDRSYLGIGSAETFSIDQINYDLLLIEVIGVYCPQCQVQAPLFNDLFSRIRKRSDTSERIKMLAIAAGANPTEVSYLKKQFKIPYPVIRDPGFEIHKLLGEPKTPFIMIVTKSEKVIFAHLGIIKNIDTFYLQIQNFLQKVNE